MTAKIVVVGSANTDFIIKVPQLPAKGETVLGAGFRVARGGKGANQAVAAARLGTAVTLVARLGEDIFGRQALEAYQSENLDTDFIVFDDGQATGVALILVDEGGENMIAVAPGSNGQLSPQDVLAAEGAIRQADCLLVQLEIPTETVQTALEIGRRSGVRTILNPAPAKQIPLDIYKFVDILTPNESEAALLAGETPGGDIHTLLAGLAARTGVPDLVVTLGAHGAAIRSGGQVTQVPAYPVVAVDATAAGDAFNGVLAVALARGSSLPVAVRYANAAGALAATRPGAQPSLPTLGELETFISSSPTPEIRSEHSIA